MRAKVWFFGWEQIRVKKNADNDEKEKKVRAWVVRYLKEVNDIEEEGLPLCQSLKSASGKSRDCWI